MPNVKKIERTMIKQKIPEETMAKFDFPDDKEIKPEELIAFIKQMDKLLPKELCLSIMEQQGCCKTGKSEAAHRAFGRKHAGKTVEERIKLFPELDTPHKAPCHINSDGTLSVYWGTGEEGNYKCVCSTIKKLPEPYDIPRTYCGCCGGHIRHNYQNSLGVSLRLKEIVSSPISSGGKKRCEFIYEIKE